MLLQPKMDIAVVRFSPSEWKPWLSLNIRYADKFRISCNEIRSMKQWSNQECNGPERKIRQVKRMMQQLYPTEFSCYYVYSIVPSRSYASKFRLLRSYMKGKSCVAKYYDCLGIASSRHLLPLQLFHMLRQHNRQRRYILFNTEINLALA
jgi:hypothetical protein